MNTEKREYIKELLKKSASEAGREKYITAARLKRIKEKSSSLKKMHRKGSSITSAGWATRYDARLQ